MFCKNKMEWLALLLAPLISIPLFVYYPPRRFIEFIQSHFFDKQVLFCKPHLHTKSIALTIDDVSFSNETTFQMLDYLQQQQIPCTLFLLGKSLKHHQSEEWKQVIRDHPNLFEVANHG